MVDPNLESVNPGSSSVPAPTTNNSLAGETNQTGSENISKAYEELQVRFGTQGQELGEYREFIKNITPILDQLDKSPELVQAITDGKISQDIVTAIIEGRVDVRDAAIVQQAHDDVKEKLGDKKYDLATPEAITKLVETQVDKVRKEFEEKAELKTFQDYTQNFIEHTADFQQYAEEIDKWLDTHDVSDIEIAYYAVKGKMSEANAKVVSDALAAERSKELMINAQGGGLTSQFTSDGRPVVDLLIAGRPSPNSFFN